MTKREIITATFAEIGKLEVRVAGRGSGTVTSNPAGITCPGRCSEPYGIGCPVTLAATPAAGSYFAGWSLSEGCGDPVSTCTFTMPSQGDLEVALFRFDHCLVPNVKRMPLARARNRLVD
jgi:hypothetical protein